MAPDCDEDDPLVEYINRFNIKIKDAKKLRNILYDHVVDTIENRISTQAGRISNEHLKQYAKNLFLNDGEEKSVSRSRAVQSDKCVLEVRVYKAESLAPKDVEGTSDPYCVIGLCETDLFTNLRAKKNAPRYNTTVVQASLSPEWNECIEIPLLREQIESSYLHIQVWDYDDDESMASALQSFKNVKGLRGMGRYMKEVAQTVGKKDSADDFMGFVALPLKNVKLEGQERWLGLRAASTLENISGRIRIGLKICCPHILLAEAHHPGKTSSIINGKRIKNVDITDEEIYGGILSLVVNGRHNIYKDLMEADGDESTTVDGWDGRLQNVDECLLMEFESQRRISKLTQAIARWEIYCQEHVKLPDGIQMQCMTELLKVLDSGNDDKALEGKAFLPLLPVAGRGEKCSIFTFDNLSKSFDKFLKHCHGKIEQHTELYKVKQNDTLIRVGELLICLRTIRESKSYMTARFVDTSMFGSGDVLADISESIAKGLQDLYRRLCQKYEIETVEEDQIINDNTSEGYNIPGMVKLVDNIHTALVNGRGYYHPVFRKVMKVDYMEIAMEVICTHLARDLMNMLPKVNKTLTDEPDPVEEGAANMSTAMFQLYLSLRDFAGFVEEISIDKNTKSNDSNEHIGALKGYHEWFRPTILRWLEMARGRAMQRLSAAVELDKVIRIDDVAKHSSSSVDAIGCLTSVITFWHQIKWPDPMDELLIATRITEDIARGVELYADLVHDKLKAVGFFDDEGQFDVTEELCLALNNLENVKNFLKNVLKDMNIKSLAKMIGEIEGAPSEEKLLQSFESLIKNADDVMRKKVMEITAVVGSKMQPDIARYFEHFVAHVMKVPPRKPDGNPLNGHESDYDLHKEDWESIGEEGIRPLMKYLTTNIMTLKEWLCDSNFRILLKVLWDVSLRCIRSEMLTKQKYQKPHLFSLGKYILKDHLVLFFHADGEGLDLNTMFSTDEYKAVELELKMRSASTKNLMRLFFSQMYEIQQAMTSSPNGILNVFACYDNASESIKVDIISAENLIPKDMNGLSDPFVQISLMPKVIFPTHPTKQTVQVKKTLNPIWQNESYTFEVDKETASLEGATMVFTVFDYDVIGRNDVEGECALPLNILDGMASDGTKSSRNFKMTLILPHQSNMAADRQEQTDAASAEPLVYNSLDLLLQRTSYDRDAAEFCRWRRKLQDAANSDDVPGPSNLLKSLAI